MDTFFNVAQTPKLRTFYLNAANKIQHGMYHTMALLIFNDAKKSKISPSVIKSLLELNTAKSSSLNQPEINANTYLNMALTQKTPQELLESFEYRLKKMTINELLNNCLEYLDFIPLDSESVTRTFLEGVVHEHIMPPELFLVMGRVLKLPIILAYTETDKELGMKKGAIHIKFPLVVNIHNHDIYVCNDSRTVMDVARNRLSTGLDDVHSAIEHALVKLCKFKETFEATFNRKYKTLNQMLAFGDLDPQVLQDLYLKLLPSMPHCARHLNVVNFVQSTSSLQLKIKTFAAWMSFMPSREEQFFNLLEQLQSNNPPLRVTTA